MTKTFRLKLGTSIEADRRVIASAREALGHAMELCGHVMLEDDLIVDPLDYSGGFVRVPEQTGLGVALDVDALDRYATAAPVVLERSR
jgi:L-alanine-DL-glutamate epimerase-like enolase superfamily enzyme